MSEPIPATLFQSFDEDGYLLLRDAVPAAWIGSMRIAFEAGALPSEQWPVPRGGDWRHAQLDTDPVVQRVCRLPVLLASVRYVLKGPFFLSQVEGRAPCAGNAPQPLHRDGAGSPDALMAAMVWLDPYGADNGATRIVPGSHHAEAAEGREAIVLAGAPGDILIFDPNVLHGATCNRSGAPRRALLLSFAAAALRAEHIKTEALRNVQMDTAEIF